MTDLLQKAIDRVSELSDDEQDAVAHWILAELESERRWDRSFHSSADTLQDRASEAREEYRAGETRELDPDKL